MSDDGTSGYAPKSPDLSSFYSTPAQDTTSTTATTTYDFDLNNVHNYLHNRGGSYLQLPPTSAWQQYPKSPSSSSPQHQHKYQQQQLFDPQQHQQQAQPQPQPILHQQGPLPQQPHYVPPSPSHHEYYPPQPITPGGGYQYNSTQQVNQQQQQKPLVLHPTYPIPYGGYQPPAGGPNPYAHSHSHSHSSSTSTEHLQGTCTSSPTMPPRRAAAAMPLVNSDVSASDSNGPVVRTKFPTARIKRIMQADEEVGKVAQSTPIAVGKALELFMVQLVTKSADQARQKGSKRVSAQMLKDVIEGDEQWDFLRDIASKVEENEKKGRGAKAETTDSEEEPAEGKRKGRRKKKTG